MSQTMMKSSDQEPLPVNDESPDAENNTVPLPKGSTRRRLPRRYKIKPENCIPAPEKSSNKMEGSTTPPEPNATQVRETADATMASPKGSVSTSAQQADKIRDSLFSGFMCQIIGCGFNLPDIKSYLERLLVDAGIPTDPIERMMLEQLAMSHFRIAQLHVSASTHESVDAVKIYNTGAARLLGEFRRSALALQTYQAGILKGKEKKAKAKTSEKVGKFA